MRLPNASNPVATGVVTPGVKPPGRLALTGPAASYKKASPSPKQALKIRIVANESNRVFFCIMVFRIRVFGV